jgi:hypothetical protein
VSLDRALRAHLTVLEGTEIEWLSPLADKRYEELRDETFWEAIERPGLAGRSAEWWPNKGPAWDAVALARRADGDVLVLVEAKAHAREVAQGALGASDPASIAMIEAALEATRARLESSAQLEAWIGPCYQLANRLAWASWLDRNGVKTVLAHVLFEDDMSHIPTSREELADAVEMAHATLGLADLPDWATTIYLPAAG